MRKIYCIYASKAVKQPFFNQKHDLFTLLNSLKLIMFEKYSKEQYQIFLVGNLTKYIKINIINCLSHAKTIMNKQKVLKILNELKPHRELAE